MKAVSTNDVQPSSATSSTSAKTPLPIDAARLDGWSRELARFSDDPAPAVKRVLMRYWSLVL